MVATTQMANHLRCGGLCPPEHIGEVDMESDTFCALAHEYAETLCKMYRIKEFKETCEYKCLSDDAQELLCEQYKIFDDLASLLLKRLGKALGEC